MEKIRLPASEVAKLKEYQRELHDILAEFDKLEECGGECADLRHMHQEHAAHIAALLKNYS